MNTDETDSETDRVVGGNISLYPQDWERIDALAQRLGMTRSAALRFIVRDWSSRSTILDAIAQAEAQP